MSLSRDESQIREKSTPLLYFQIYREDKYKRLFKLPIDDLSTLTLTYFNHSTGTTVNGRSSQNVKNANNVSVSETCEVRWAMQAEDTTCADTTLEDGKLERHEALFEWATADGIASSTRVTVYIIRDSKV